MGRGVYRSVYSSLADDPDFQRLSPFARLLLYTARLCAQAGPGAIFRWYPEILMRQTGLRRPALVAALAELREGRWIEQDDAVLWVRNGLRFDPFVRLADKKHRRAIENAVQGLPHSPVVLSFCDYYEIARPFEDPSKTLRRGGAQGEGIGEGIGVRNPPLPPPPAAAGSSKGLEANGTPPAAPPATLTPDQLFDCYNAETPDECPAIVVRSPERRRKARQALARFPDPEFWHHAFRAIHASRFLRGLAAATPNHRTPFVADFDWLLARHRDGTENVVKVHDGRYR